MDSSMVALKHVFKKIRKKNRGVIKRFSRQCHDAGCSVLETLKKGYRVVRKTVEKSIAVVKTRSKKCMNHLFSGNLVQVVLNEIFKDATASRDECDAMVWDTSIYYI